MESYIFKAFVKGIMKTSGGLLVLGIGMCIYDNVNLGKVWEKHCGDNYKACSAEIEKIKRFNEYTNGDITVLKTDKDDTGQLYVRGHIFKAWGKLNQEKKTEIQESEFEADEIETNCEQSQETENKDFKKLFTF